MLILQTPELAGAIRTSDRRRKKVKYIIIHRNTVSKLWIKENPRSIKTPVEAAAAWYQERDWRLFPYHFFLDNPSPIIPDIAQIHSLDTVAPHASGYNNNSVGITLNVDGRIEEPSDQLELTTIWLLAHLLSVFPEAKIVRHSYMSPKDCPGDKIDVETFRSHAEFFATPFTPEERAAAQIREKRPWE